MWRRYIGRTCSWYWERIEAGERPRSTRSRARRRSKQSASAAATEEAQVVEGVDVGPVEGKEALDEQEVGGGEVALGRLARVGGKVVHWDFNAVAGGELAEIRGEALVVHGLGASKLTRALATGDRAAKSR